MKKYFCLLIFIGAMVGCRRDESRQGVIIKDSLVVEQVQQPFKDTKAIADSISLLQRRQNMDRLELLKKKFKYTKDEFEKTGWYIHKDQVVSKSFNRNCLKVHINATGYCYLEDQYYGSDWVFHTQIQVKIDSIILTSENLETFSDDNKTESGSEGVWENISYTGGRDNGILKAIAATAAQSVKVRYVGKQSVFDFTLAPKDQQAIKDGYELAELIKKTGS